MSTDEILAQARATLETEAEAVREATGRLGEPFVRAVELLLAMRGYAVVSGIGKSGAVARKLAGTLASTGTPAFFMHPGEAVHGELGVITDTSVVIMLSNSGETDEVLAILPEIKRRGVPIIALCGRADSTLAREAAATLDASVREEACPLGMAPTASTMVQMALGDALAMATMRARGFTEEDYGHSHPGGTLGRRVLLRVADLMHGGAHNPVVSQDATVEEALLVMTQAAVRGAVSVVDGAGFLRGLFTDGMLRVLMQRHEDRNQLMRRPVREVMTANPTTCTPEMLAAEAVHLLQERDFDNVPVVDRQGRSVGMLDVQDLMRAAVV